MNVLYLLLLIGALVCFLLAAARSSVVRFELVAAGLALWVLVPLIQLVRAL